MTKPRTGNLNRTTSYHPACRHLPSDTTSSEDADVIDDGDIEAGCAKRTSARVTMVRRLKPEASSSVAVRRRRSLATAVGVIH